MTTTPNGPGREESARDDSARAKKIFVAAIALPADQRDAFVAKQCGHDAALREKVIALVCAHEEASGFLDDPTDGGAPPPASADSLDPSASLAISSTASGAASAMKPWSGAEKPGTKIGPYKLLQQVGEGGFGVVFMAEQQFPVRRRVALKIIKLGMDTRQVIARFEAERQALAMMDHPNIARVLDAGATESGRPYFVMELVKGEPITAYCDRNSLDIPARLDLFAQVCRAVQHAHQKGVIHRDIKPNNVIVSTQDGRPHAKVIDFGIAKATDHRLTEKTLFTELQALIGTPAYMSPEQAEGSLDIDTRTDVYSLGVLLYELLTGVTPFDPAQLREAAYGEIQRIIREIDPPKPSTRLSLNMDTLPSIAAQRRSEPKKLGGIVRGELDWIVMKAMDKDRQRRYDTAVALADDVGRYLNREAVVAAPPSAMYRLRKFVRRNRGAVVTGGSVAAALMIGLIGIGYFAMGEAHQRKEAENKTMENKELFELLRQGQQNQWDLGGKLVARHCSEVDAFIRLGPSEWVRASDLIDQIEGLIQTISLPQILYDSKRVEALHTMLRNARADDWNATMSELSKVLDRPIPETEEQLLSDRADTEYVLRQLRMRGAYHVDRETEIAEHEASLGSRLQQLEVTQDRMRKAYDEIVSMLGAQAIEIAGARSDDFPGAAAGVYTVVLLELQSENHRALFAGEMRAALVYVNDPTPAAPAQVVADLEGALVASDADAPLMVMNAVGRLIKYFPGEYGDVITLRKRQLSSAAREVAMFCPTCSGTLKAPCPRCNTAGPKMIQKPCTTPKCQGRGSFSCPTCDGDSLQPCHKCHGDATVIAKYGYNKRTAVLMSFPKIQEVWCAACWSALQRKSTGQESCKNVSCHNGQVTCSVCKGDGQVEARVLCPDCRSKRVPDCTACNKTGRRPVGAAGSTGG